MATTPYPTLPRSTASGARPAPKPVPLAPSARRLAGRYRYDRRADTWTWSPAMSVLLNLAPVLSGLGVAQAGVSVPTLLAEAAAVAIRLLTPLLIGGGEGTAMAVELM